ITFEGSHMPRSLHSQTPLLVLLSCVGGLLWTTAPAALRAQGPNQKLIDAEARRIAVIERAKPSAVAVFAHGGRGGRSGVVISKDGYALTNFHVVMGPGGGSQSVMQCGLPDGVLYDAVVVGFDQVGDVALLKLLPKKPGQEFPAAPLADSDKV